MTNKFPGPCKTCGVPVPAGEGNYIPATKVLTHTRCPDAKPKQFSITRCISLNAFEAEVNAQDDPAELSHIRSILNGMNRRNEKHVLNHAQYGYGAAYAILDRRAKALELTPYSGGYFKSKTS